MARSPLAKGRHLVSTQPFFQTAAMETRDLTTKNTAKKPKNVRNWSSRARFGEPALCNSHESWPRHPDSSGCVAVARASSAGSPATEDFEGWPDSRGLHDS